MALRGNLKDFSLPDVFQLVTFSRKTGVLRIQRGDDAQGSVWFRDGDVFFAQSNWHTEPLGERLVRAQRLTPQALDRALQLRLSENDDSRRLGQILIDEGYITGEVLEAFVSEQIQDTIFDLMRWDDGDFDFEAMPEAVEEDIGLSVSIENVIMEGSRRLEEWTRIKKKIPSVDVVFKMATAPGEGTFEISLKPMEWNLLLLVDGTRSVAELAHQTDRTDFEVARIVYGLFSAGLLEFATDEELERLRAERAVRETRLAVLEAERRAVEEAAAAEVRAREAALAAEEEARRAVDAATAAAAEATAQAAAEATAQAAAEAAAQAAAEAAAQAAAEAAAQAPVPVFDVSVEVPEFLGGMSSVPTADDAAVLEEMMGAVLRPPTIETQEPLVASVEVPDVPIQPHVPAEDPAFMAVDHVDTADLPMMPVPSVDELLTDLADLRVPELAAADEAADAVVAAWDVTPASVVDFVLEPSESDTLLPVEATMEEIVAPEILSEPEIAEPSVTEVTPSDSVSVFDFTYTPSSEDETDAAPIANLIPAVEEPVALSADWVFEAVAAPASVVEPLLVADDADVEPFAETVEEELAEDVFVRVEPVPGQEAFVQEAPEPSLAPEDEAEISASTDGSPVVAVDFERDLMSLGLGELPSDLFTEVAADTGPEPETDEPTYEWVDTPETTVVGLADMVPGPDTAPDFSELLESLDVDPEPLAIEPEPATAPVIVADADFDEDLLREVEAAQTGGVISTDGFLDDITMDDMDFSGGLTDELSALTGADRPSRPTTNVNRIADPDSGELLHRDSRVDRDTLLRIIDGIKSL